MGLIPYFISCRHRDNTRYTTLNSLPVRNEVKDFVGMVTHATLMRRYQQELLGES